MNTAQNASPFRSQLILLVHCILRVVQIWLTSNPDAFFFQLQLSWALIVVMCQKHLFKWDKMAVLEKKMR